MGGVAASALPDPRRLRLHRLPELPVSVVTGFLGSGKTTLIRRLLTAEEAADTAVIVNEFGEVALDHLLLEHATEDIVLLPGGCLCCQARNDLVRALRTLHDKRERRELPPYKRVVIETSGLADPGPILQTFTSDPIRLSRYRLAGLVTVVDALHGKRHLGDFDVARLQLALADRVVLSKLDIADENAARSLRGIIEGFGVACAEPPAEGTGLLRQLFLFEGDLRSGHAAAITHSESGHSDGFTAICRRPLGPLSLAKLEEGLIRLAASRGEWLLRLKGIVDVTDAADPVAIHVVQHTVDRPRPFRCSTVERAIVAIVPLAAQHAVGSALAAMLEHAAENSD